MPDLSPKERRQQRTKQAILDAAHHIINQDGPDALSIRAIADRIDYSPAGLYEYFGGKDEIIAAVCEQGDERLSNYMAMVDTSLPVDAYLREIGHSYIRFAVENPDHFLLMFTHNRALDPIEPEQMIEERSSFGILLATIQRGIEEGVFACRPNFDLMGMAYAAWALVHGISMLRVANLKGYPMDFDTLDSEVLDNLIRGLKHQKNDD